MQDKNASPFLNIIKTPFEGFNRFIVADLRDGRLSLEGLSFPVKALTIIGFTLLFVAAFLMIFFDPIRQNSELLTLQNSNLVPRGSSIATLTIPLTIFLVTCGFAYILTGAIRIQRLFLILILTVYYGSISLFVLTAFPNLSLNFSIRSVLIVSLSLASILTIPIFMFVRRRWREPRPVYEFAVLFICCFLIMQASQFNLIVADTFQNREFTSINIDSYLSAFVLFTLPFFLQIGMEIAKFVRKLSFWSAEIIYFRFSDRFQLIYLALAVITVWQLYLTGTGTIEYFSNNDLQSSLLGYTGAAGVILIVWIIWWGMKRISRLQAIPFEKDDDIDEATDWLILPAIGLTVNLGFLPLIALLLIPIILLSGILLGWGDGFNRSVTLFFERISQVEFFPIVIAAIVTILWGIWLARQRRVISAVYISLFGTLFLWNNLTNAGRPLAILEWTSSTPVDFWWSLLLLGFIGYWGWHKELTIQRAISLLILSIATTLIFRQQDFIEEPLYLLLEFSGTGLIVFGVIWDSVTVGNWANESSPALPRPSRIFLYVGYVLLALGVILWAMGQRDYFMLDIFTGGGALLGAQLLGRPMIFMLFPLLLSLPKDQLPISQNGSSTMPKSGRVTA